MGSHGRDLQYLLMTHACQLRGYFIKITHQKAKVRNWLSNTSVCAMIWLLRYSEWNFIENLCGWLIKTVYESYKKFVLTFMLMAYIVLEMVEVAPITSQQFVPYDVFLQNEGDRTSR